MGKRSSSCTPVRVGITGITAVGRSRSRNWFVVVEVEVELGAESVGLGAVVVVGISDQSLVGVGPSVGSDPGDPGDHCHCEFSVVDVGVVAAAGQDEVVEVGKSSVAPPFHVVR
jgi:hypothetical protein